MSSPASWAWYRPSIAARNPARVLPEPVGAQTSVCRPDTMAGQPPAWASVGPSGKRRSNQVRTAGWKRSRIAGEAVVAGTDGSEVTDTGDIFAAASARTHMPAA
jgi:hypothetical protein